MSVTSWKLNKRPKGTFSSFNMLSNNPGPMIRCTSMAAPDDLTGEPVSLGEERVHVIGLVLEQKETKETKNSGGNTWAIRLARVSSCQ